jgi:hypothetical protein
MRIIKIKRGFTEPQTLLDGELGYDISSKTLYIGNGGGKDTLFVGGSVYPKIHADYNYYKKADKNALEGYLEVVNGRIPRSLIPTSLGDWNLEEIFEVDYVYVPGMPTKQMFTHLKTPYDFGTSNPDGTIFAPGVSLGYDINGDEFADLSNSVTWISWGMYGEYYLRRKNGASGTTETLQVFNDDGGQGPAGGLFICRYDGHVYRIDTNGEEYWVRGFSTPPDVIDGGTW